LEDRHNGRDSCPSYLSNTFIDYLYTVYELNGGNMSMKRAILFYAFALVMCHTLEYLTGTNWGAVIDVGYLIGLAIYLLAFTAIYSVISRAEYSFQELWVIGAIIGALVEVPLGILTVSGIVKGGVEDILGLLIVTVFFWGLLYTAVNYSIVKRVRPVS
jgi:hypothetical protein